MTDGANFTYGPVGREKQLDLIAETIRGENKVGLVLLGEAGIGKTTLARVARTLARTNGLCSAFVQVAETKGFPSRHALVHLVSQLEECRDQHQKLDKQTDQTELGRPSSYVPSLIEIVQTLDDAGSSSPLVLIVDDLHLMPRRSAQELWAIVRASRSDIRFIGTARATHSGDLSHLGSSGDFPLLWHLLEPLTREGIIELSRRLLGGDLLPSAGALLSKRSQGNPLLARITLEEWRRHGSLIEVADYWDVSSDAYDEEPLSLTQAMQGRLVGLSRHELEMLQTIAILDRSLTLEECERYASLGVNVALDSVTTLIEAGFVVAERGSQTVVSISHPTIQSAAVASLDPVRRARLHEHIFERMLDRRMGLNDLPVTEVAHHGVLGLRKRPELVGCLEEAARYALEGEDHAAAASWFRALLDIQGASSDWRTWFRYATATSNLSPEDAIQHFSEALARSSDDDARAQILFGRAVAHRRVGGFEEAKADLERASTLESALRDFDIPHAIAALLAIRGHFEQAENEFRLLIEQTDGRQEKTRALGHLAQMRFCLGDLRESIEICNEALQYELDGEYRRFLEGNVTWYLFLAGAWPQSQELFAGAISRCRESNDLWNLVSLAASFGVFLALKGVFPEALDTALQSLRLSEHLENSAIRLDALGSLAWIYLEMARFEDAVSLLPEVDRLTLHDLEPREQTTIYRIMGESALAVNDIVAAHRLHRSAQDNLSWARVWHEATDRLDMQIALAERNPAHALQIAQPWLASPGPVIFEHAHLLEVTAQALLKIGKRQDAILRVDEAIAIYEGLGATKRCERARRWRSEHYRRRPGRPRSELPGGVTERERDVLELVILGKTNREIAEALVLSVLTVNKHVENIMTKAGVARRTELVAYAERLGLRQPASA